jgi:hypothetical protein
MKKLTSVLFALFIFLTLSSCGNNETAEGKNTTTEVKFFELEALFRPYRDAQEIIELRNNDVWEMVIFVGKVTDISFQVLDLKTGAPPTEKTEERYRFLNTIYEIDISTVYMGEPRESAIRMDGGVKGYKEEEQIRLIKDESAWPNDGIPILEWGTAEIEIGETYLFVAGQFDIGLPTLINLDQSFYNLRNPFEKHHNDITAKDIISALGEDKWDSFWTQWQKDNPNWETWLDKETVENELAK